MHMPAYGCTVQYIFCGMTSRNSAVKLLFFKFKALIIWFEATQYTVIIYLSNTISLSVTHWSF